MERVDNYAIQASQAKKLFLTYDQEKLIRKLRLKADEDYLYATLWSFPYRLSLKTGDLERQTDGIWTDANTFEEVMTLLDLICDSREDRFVTGRYKDMADFGKVFHRNLLEKDPWAYRFDANPEGLRQACIALKGTPFPKGDVAYILEIFDGLTVVVQLWQGDEEFPPRFRLLWDENASMYIRYETMYFAKGLLLRHLSEYL